jgi:mycothiol synthase
MNASPRLSALDPQDPAGRSRLLAIADAAASADGADPFNEQSRLDLGSGRRAGYLILDATDDPVGAAILGHGELDLVVAPDARRAGYATAALTELLDTEVGPLTAWSHGDHPGAHRLASTFGFEATRTLLQLEMPLRSDSTAGGARTPPPVAIEAFRPGTDDDEWVRLNAQVFAFHPEQGAMSVDDLHERQRESWFDAGDFLIARDDSGRMVGYNWLKVENDGVEREGEIYVVGVDAASAGRGIGRQLMLAGLERLRQRGCSVATLYVEADNDAAVGLYRSLGFTDRTVDVQFTRRVFPDGSNVAALVT